MNVEEIIIKALREMGADGLCSPEGCGCSIDDEDFMPCGYTWHALQCVPAKQGEDGRYRPMVDDREEKKRKIEAVVRSFCDSQSDLEYEG